MGSCFSKHTPRQRNPVHEVKHQNPAHKTQPWPTSGEQDVLPTTIPNTSPFPSSYARNDQESATSFVTSTNMRPSHSPQVTSAASSPRSVQQIVHSASQTPLGKRHSSADIYNTGSVSRLKSSASPSTVYTRPSPSAVRKCVQRRDDESSVNNIFPSVARKHWLSQTEYASFSRKGSAKDLRVADGLETPAESISNATSYTGFDKSQASTTISSTAVASRKSTTETFTSSKTSPAHDLRAVSYAASRRSSASRSLNLGHSSAPASRRNSISRDQHNTFDPSRENTRPSSPLKRHSSVKDHASVPGSPRLSRNNSSKGCSPSRNVASSRQDCKSRSHYRLSGGNELSSGQFGNPVASGHRRYSSRDSVPEFASSNNIRRPSPPKRTPVIVSTSNSVGSEFNKLSVKRSASASYQKTFAREDDVTANTSSRNVKKKESSYPAIVSNDLAYLNSSNWTRIMDGSTDLSINSDTFSFRELELKTSNRNKKPATRRPLKEISDNGRGINNAKSDFSRLSLKDATKKPQDLQQSSQNEMPIHALCHSRRDAATIFGNADEDKDPLEVKAESLVMGGKSVLSAFKALEEYRLKYSNIDALQSADEVSWCMGPEDSMGERMEIDENQRPASHQNLQQVSDVLMTRSSVKSCEPFLFSDVESLISEKDGMQLEGMQIPPSISKACSILKAVADLNKGTSKHSRFGTQDEIGIPKMSSFSFME